MAYPHRDGTLAPNYMCLFPWVDAQSKDTRPEVSNAWVKANAQEGIGEVRQETLV
jgi:hypothetical protein